jgi:hypothetical protein
LDEGAILGRLVPSSLLSHDGGLGSGGGVGEFEVVDDVDCRVISKNFRDSLDTFLEFSSGAHYFL